MSKYSEELIERYPTIGHLRKRTSEHKEIKEKEEKQRQTDDNITNILCKARQIGNKSLLRKR